MSNNSRSIEKAIATGSFLSAVAFAFTSLIIAPNHDITASQLMMVAQFLTLTATLLGIDYKFSQLKTKL